MNDIDELLRALKAAGGDPTPGPAAPAGQFLMQGGKLLPLGPNGPAATPVQLPQAAAPTGMRPAQVTGMPPFMDKPAAADGGPMKLGMANLSPMSFSPFAPQSLLSQMPAGAGLNLSPVQLAPQQAAPQVGGPQVQITNRQWRPRAQFGPTGYMGTTLEEPDQSGVEAAGLANMQGQMAAAGEQAKLQAASQAQGSAQQAAAAMQAQKLGVDSNSKLLDSLNAGIASNNSAGIAGQAHVEGAKLGADAHRDAARAHAEADHGLQMNRTTENLLAALNSGKLTKDEYNANLAAMRAGSRPGAPAVPPASTAPSGGPAGTPASAPPPPPPPPNLDDIQAANQIGHGLTPLGPDGKPLKLTPQHIDNFLLRYGGASPAVQSLLLNNLKAGRLGDANTTIPAVASRVAGSYLALQPPLTPSGGVYDPRIPQTNNTPSSYQINGDDGKTPLFTLRAGPTTGLKTIGNYAAGAGFLPFNQMELPGYGTVPVDPTDLYNMWKAQASPDQLRSTAGHGSALLRGLGR